MNITAINSTTNLSRPRVPSFCGAAATPAQVAQVAADGAQASKGFFAALKKVPGNVWKSVKAAGGWIKKQALKVPGLVAKAANTVKDTAVSAFNHIKGSKKIKAALVGLTAIVSGGFAVKEAHDIITKSNPENK